MKFIIIATMLASTTVAPDIGPKPTMEEFVALAEPAAASKLKEPTSASFRWPYQLLNGPVGYYTCGLVRSRNNGGGYSEIWISVVVANGRIVSSQSAESNGMLAWDCKRQVKKGVLIPR